jgi:chitobiase/beta-hexosaminidase-like protein
VIPYGGGFNTMTILRHRLGTTAQSHAANANCFFIFRSDLKLIDNAKFIPGASVLFKLQPFTHQQDYDLLSITPISYTVVGWGNLAAPVLNPPPGPFYQRTTVHASSDAGLTIRYTEDGSEVTGVSPKFPVNGKLTTSTKTYRLRAFAADGRVSMETIGLYTKVDTPPATQQCSPPRWSFTGQIGYSSGTLTLTPTTSGSVVKYTRNSGPAQTYSTPLTVASNNTGDVIEFWAIKAGLDDSSHFTLDNTSQDPRGGGHGPPINP